MAVGDPTIAQLRAFVAVARLGHFGEAADALRISQPTLSQAIATLEGNLDLQLIERHARRLLITEDGQRLLPAAERAVAAMDSVIEQARPTEWLKGSLVVGIIPTIAPYLLPAMLREVRRDAPDLDLRVREDQTARLLRSLHSGDIDVAILAVPTGEAGVREIPLYDEDFLLAAPADSPVAGGTDLALSDLVGQHLLLLEEGHCLRDQTLAICAEAGADPADPVQSTSLATVVQLVSAGMGVTLLPATAVAVESRGTSLGIATFAAPAPARRVGLAIRASSARHQEFEDFGAIVRRAIKRRRMPVRPVVA